MPPSTRLRLRTVLVISFHRASRGALTNQLPASCWLALMEATTSPWFGGGGTTMFQSADTALRLTCSRQRGSTRPARPQCLASPVCEDNTFMRLGYQ